jgi:phosphomannomutase
MADDPDPKTRDELAPIIEAAEAGDASALDDVADRFAGFLQFGTAGLRGALGAGPNRMNRAVVIRAASGLATYLNEQRTPTNGRRHLVVIGFDARHGSHQFAVDTAAVMIAAGIDAKVMPRTLPTPVLAFAVRHLNADAGVMVTASHNPPQDNGYKVYLGGPDDGSQIVPPADTDIAAHIDAVISAIDVPLAQDGWTEIDEDVIEAYLTSAAAVVDPDSPQNVRIVLTPMHGVGGATAVEALHRAGFSEVLTVPDQEDPDPDFPTVAFPNPEEPGALDLAVKYARDVKADVIVANDPDADRCAVAVPDSSISSGWRMLRGDDVGALIGDHLAKRGATGTFANSIVSSRLLGRIAAANGLGHAETLTGFKWVSRVPDLSYGYEEALGYCVDPGSVRDKDGVSAAVLVAEIVAGALADGYDLPKLLDTLACQHGLYATDQLSIRVEDLSLIADAMQALRDAPPADLAGSPVVRSDDLSTASADLPPTDGLRYYTEDQSRVIVRPSGTEPKLKCYLEVVVEVVDDNVENARSLARERLQRLRDELGARLGK